MPQPTPLALPFRRLRSDAAAIGLVMLVSLILVMIPTVFGHLPPPQVHDEFANLLAADTFAHGRLTNPSPKLPQFFESFHILVQPTYMSKFPVGQALSMALGQIVWQPILGVWLMVALGCAASTWMFLAVLPRRWATLGGVLMASHPVIIFWAENYWGGGFALFAGALVGGAALRIRQFRGSPVFLGVIGGIGAALLLISRPFEGAIVCSLLGLVLFYEAFKFRHLVELTRSIAAATPIVCAMLAWISYDCWRVTGNALKLPYVLHSEQYMIAPLMFWQAPNLSRTYRHVVFEHFFRGKEYPEYAAQMTWSGYFQGVWFKIKQLCDIFLRVWALPVLPLLATLGSLRSRVVRWAWYLVIGLPLLQMMLTPWLRHQYMAPATPWFFLLIAIGMVRLDPLRAGRFPVGRMLVVLLCLLWIVPAALMEKRFLDPLPPGNFASQRLAMLKEVDRLPAGERGQRLIFVHHSLDGTIWDTVYNGADLDAATNLFVRDMGSIENHQLIALYPTRAAYRLDIDSWQLQPYAPATAPGLTQ